MFNPVNIKTPEVQAEEQAQAAAEKATQQFRADRQHALDTAVVTSTLGNQYDADEQSMLRMGANIKAGELAGKQDADTVQWSLADTDTGVMNDVPFSDLKEAYVLAAANMGQIWGRT
jgi:FPC/CPF motif-containing protein YcgG